MLSKQEIITGMNALADQVEAMCSEHEAEAHAGHPCIANRLSAVAFLMHRLGLREGVIGRDYNGEDITANESLWAIVADYEENCPHCKEKRRAAGEEQGD